MINRIHLKHYFQSIKGNKRMSDKSEDKIGISISINDINDWGIFYYKAVGNTMKITLEKAIEVKRNLTRAKIRHEPLDGIDLTKGKLNDCVFNDCSMVGVKFNGTRCARAAFMYVNLDRSDISNQEMINWQFTTCQLTNIDFGELDMTHCIFDGVDFAGSDLSKAKYDIGQFDNCYMTGTKMNPDPLQQTKRIKAVDLDNPN